MLFPNKLFSYEESVLSKFPVILTILKEGQMAVSVLYQTCKDSFSGVSEFIEVLDCLFALGKIRTNSEMEVELC